MWQACLRRAAPLRSPTVFLRVQHMASCADRRAQAGLAGCKTLASSRTRETRTEQTPSIPPRDVIRPMATRTSAARNRRCRRALSKGQHLSPKLAGAPPSPSCPEVPITKPNAITKGRHHRAEASSIPSSAPKYHAARGPLPELYREERDARRRGGLRLRRHAPADPQ